MILNKYSLNVKMHPYFNFETLYIKFQEEFLKFAFFQKLVLKLKNIIYYFTYRLWGLFLKIFYYYFFFLIFICPFFFSNRLFTILQYFQLQILGKRSNNNVLEQLKKKQDQDDKFIQNKFQSRKWPPVFSKFRKIN